MKNVWGEHISQTEKKKNENKGQESSYNGSDIITCLISLFILEYVCLHIQPPLHKIQKNWCWTLWYKEKRRVWWRKDLFICCFYLFIACSLPLIHHNVLHFQQQKCTFLTTIEDFKIILIRTITINLASKIGMAYVCSWQSHLLLFKQHQSTVHFWIWYNLLYFPHSVRINRVECILAFLILLLVHFRSDQWTFELW